MVIMRKTGGPPAVEPDKKVERKITAYGSRADIPLRTGTGQNIRAEGRLSQSQRDAAHVFGHGAATDLITELFRTNTAT